MSGDRNVTEIGVKPNIYSVARRLRASRDKADAESSGPSFLEQMADALVTLPDEDSPSELLYRRVSSTLEEFFKSVRRLDPCDDGAKIRELAEALVQNVLEDQAVPPLELISRADSSLFLRAFLREVEELDLIEHSIIVAVLSARMGAIIGYDRPEIVRLAFASLLHNVGMLFILPKIIWRRGPLWPDERVSIRKHSEVGAKFVESMSFEYTHIADIIHQVHEREGGQGYPQGLRGDRIFEEAKIIGLADVYVALISPRPYRDAFHPLDAMAEIAYALHDQFAHHLVKALWEALSIFFVGSFVQLNTDYLGRIIEADGVNPMRPTIEVLVDSKGKPVVPVQKMCLAEQPEIYIKATVSKGSVLRFLD